MNKKKFKIGLLVVAVLVMAFFWGGNKEVTPLTAEEIGKDAGIVEDLDIEDDEEIDDLDIEDDDEEKQDDEEEKQDDEEKLELEEDVEDVEKDKKIEETKEKTQVKEEEAKQEEVKKEKIKKDKEIKKQIIENDKKNKGKQDKYLTDPIPAGKPKPVEWQDVKKDTSKEMTATLSVTCKSILNNMDMFNMDKIEVLPKNGIIYATKTVKFYEGESVFDVLLREMQDNKIHMEFNMTPVYNSNYIEGINNLYEFDCGELSGWMYQVNGWFPNYGASRYQLKDGDKIEWIYTCDLGRDIGGGFAVTGSGD